MNEPLDNLRLAQRPAFIPPRLQLLLKIPFFRILHNYANRLPLDEGLPVLDHIAVIELLHEFDLLEDLLLGLGASILDTDALNDL